MTLRLQINLIVGILTVLFVAAVLALEVRSMRGSVNEEVMAANRVAAQLLNRTAWLYAAQGTPAMLAFLQGTGRVRSNDIILFDSQGQELYRSPPSAYKAGRDAPQWFDRLVSPPPSVQAIQFPDGKLEMHSNASRAVVDAWDYIVVLAGGALALLVIVNALLYLLVGRTVRPLKDIVDALNQLQAGRFDVVLPPLPGTEAAAIGAAFNRMVGELLKHIETEKRAVRAEAQLSDSRELTRWIDHHVEQERRMIARELHDEFGQSVTAIRSMALSIANRIAARDSQAEQAARLIADESSRLYDVMHGIIPRLTPLVLDNFGLADALRDLVERTRRAQAGVNVALQVDLADAQIEGDAALALYRAAQEGLTNALRHGQASSIDIAVHAGASRVTLLVTDNGIGLAAESSGADAAARTGHYGLRWLAERAESLGGRVAIDAAQPHGAQLKFELPLPTDKPGGE